MNQNYTFLLLKIYANCIPPLFDKLAKQTQKHHLQNICCHIFSTTFNLSTSLTSPIIINGTGILLVQEAKIWSASFRSAHWITRIQPPQIFYSFIGNIPFLVNINYEGDSNFSSLNQPFQLPKETANKEKMAPFSSPIFFMLWACIAWA